MRHPKISCKPRRLIMLRFFWLLFSCGWSLLAYAQARYTVEHLGLDAGLPHQNVRAVVQDRQGVMWFATYGNGLIRFDGQHHTVFQANPKSFPQLSSNALYDLVLDQRGRLWIASEHGIELLDPVSLRLMTVKMPFNAPAGAIVRSLYADPSGDIWAAAYSHGLVRFTNADPNSGLLMDTTSTITYVNRGVDGGIWSFPALLEKINFRLPAGEYLPDDNPNLKINRQENTDGLLTGLACISKNSQTTKYYKLDPATKQFVPGLATDAIGTQNVADFIRKFPEKAAPQTDFSNLTTDEWRVFKDQHGLIWAVPGELGVFKLRPQEVAFTTCPDLTGISLRGILEAPDGHIYISSYGGMFRYSPADNRARLLSDKYDYMFNLAALRGDSLLCMTEGQGMHFFNLRSLKEENFRPLPVLNGNNTYYASLRLGDSVVIAGNTNVFLIRLSDWTIHLLGHLPMGQWEASFAYERTRDGRLWVGTTQGVFCLSADGIGEAPSLRSNYRLGPDSRVNDIYEDHYGMLWFATRLYGLVRYDPATKQFRAFDTTNGFASNETYSIMPSLDGNLIWVSTSAGIHLVRLGDEHISIFNQLDGTSNSEFNTGSYLQTRSGEIYFGGVSGLTRFHPDSLHLQTKGPPLPFIHTINMEDRNNGIIVHLNYPARDTLLCLSPDQRTVEFRFGSTDYFQPAGNTFYVQLSGIDRDWVALGAVSFIKYHNLPAGTYTFQVKCSKDPTATDSAIYSVSFEIEEVFYKRWWFIALLAGLALGLMWLTFQLRLQQIQREQDLRQRIAADLHDDLGSNLSGISNLVHVINRLKQVGKTPDTELHKLLDLTRSAHSAMSDIIWAIDSDHQEMADLARRMEDYADKWLKTTGTKVVFETNLSGSKKTIPFFVKHQLLLAYKEILGNALKHTFSEQVTIHFNTTAGGGIMLFVQNTFVERKLDAPSTGRGLPGIQERISRIKGIVEIEEGEHVFQVRIKIAG